MKSSQLAQDYLTVHFLLSKINLNVQHQGVRYVDNKWPQDVYPVYVSGGGQLFNREALWKVQKMIEITPMLTVDDAFLGVCFQRIQLENRLIQDDRFLASGSSAFDKFKFDPCFLNKLVFYHQFTFSELNCFRQKFITSRSKCHLANSHSIKST